MLQLVVVHLATCYKITHVYVHKDKLTMVHVSIAQFLIVHNVQQQPHAKHVLNHGPLIPTKPNVYVNNYVHYQAAIASA